MEWIKTGLTVFTALFGWLLVNWLSAKREVKSKRRELVTNHLIEAYRILTQEVGRRPTTEESMTKFENLLTDIQLFGSKKEVELARLLSSQTANTGVSVIDPLIEEIRSHLRHDLELEQLEDQKTIWFRFTRTAQQGGGGDAFGAGNL